MPIPVVLDTDIGTDVDDVWALAFLLRCPEVDIKLITTATGDIGYRAKLVAKILKAVGREDIPIGVGIPLDATPRTHTEWLDDFSLADYQGDVLRDGVGALCECVESSSDPVTVLAIGPLPNIAAALARSPELTANARFVGMHGSLYTGYLGADKPAREYNVRLHALACQAVFKAPWDKTITPLDTCGDVILSEESFARVAASADPLAQIVMANHIGWAKATRDWPLSKQINLRVQSSILFDCVAVYLAFAETWLHMQRLPIVVTEDGKTLVDDAGNDVNCAVSWENRQAFDELLVERLCGDSQ
jgi:inosine-uridine nucleoside N-ribohydrolase